MLGSFITQKHNEGIAVEQRRGIQFLDLNDYLVLGQSPIEQVVQGLCQTRQVNSWERDVYEREIELVEEGSCIIYQFQKHPWTIIQSSSFFPNRMPLQDQDALSLSDCLHTKAIAYLISDTGGYIGYHFFNCGESIEKFYKEPPEDLSVEEYESDEWFGNEFIGMCEFRSQLRQIEVYEINDGYSLTDEFLREQDAYVPAFFWGWSLKVSQKVTIQLKGLEYDSLERMDYLTLS